MGHRDREIEREKVIQGQGEREWETGTRREREWETGTGTEREWETGRGREREIYVRHTEKERGRESERYGIFKIIINGNSERDALV